MNYLDLVNNVLRRMREEEVSSLYENQQSSVVADCVNDARRQVEDAHDWTCLSTDIAFNTAASDGTYSLTGTQNRGTIVDIRNLTTKYFVQYVPTQWIRKRQMIDDTVVSAPSYWSEDGIDASGDTQIQLWPTPDGIYSMSARVILRAGDLTEEGSTTPLPHMPIIHYAHAAAARERGDVQSDDVAYLFQKAQRSLGDAIMYDMGKQPENNIWYPQ